MGCCHCSSKAELRERLKRVQNRLFIYYERERDLMKKAKQYNIGSRGMTRYDTPLVNVQNAIKDLEREEAELKAMLCGKGARRAFAGVPRDW